MALNDAVEKPDFERPAQIGVEFFQTKSSSPFLSHFYLRSAFIANLTVHGRIYRTAQVRFHFPRHFSWRIHDGPASQYYGSGSTASTAHPPWLGRVA